MQAKLHPYSKFNQLDQTQVKINKYLNSIQIYYKIT